MRLTVGDIRKAIANLPDHAEVFPDWQHGYEPDDCEAGVELRGIEVSNNEPFAPYVSVLVKLFYLDDRDEPSDDEGERRD